MGISYDVAVLGGGPAGYVAAIRAAQYGLKTALIEQSALGGTCLNRGCIPTKAMLHTGEVLEEIRKAERLGIVVGKPTVDLKKLYAYKDSVVKKLVGGVGSLLKANGVDVYKGRGAFEDRYTLKVTAGEAKPAKPEKQVSARHILIAAGSKPLTPPIDGLEKTGYWTSNTLLEDNPDIPKSMIIIGGGVIGTECATILKDLGVEVTLVEMMDQLLPQMDRDAAETLRKSLKKEGIEIHTGVKVTEVSQKNNGKSCRIETGEGERTLEAEEIMVAVGRGPVIDIPGVEKLGLKTDRKGFVVNENLQTTVENIYAAGDVSGKWQLAHAASAEGIAVIDHIAGKPNYTNREIVPSCIYTRPEIASVGISAKEAEENGYSVALGTFPMAANGKAMISGDTAGFVKIVSDAQTGELLGAQIVGPRATDMIGELAAAMSAEVTVEEIAAAIHPHPTVSEAIMEALHDIEGLSAHKPPGKEKKR